MKTYEPGETPLVPAPGQTYELSLLIRNTGCCARLLRVWHGRLVRVLAVRYGRNSLTGGVRISW
jgi:hypothetical protein